MESWSKLCIVVYLPSYSYVSSQVTRSSDYSCTRYICMYSCTYMYVLHVCTTCSTTATKCAHGLNGRPSAARRHPASHRAATQPATQQPSSPASQPARQPPSQPLRRHPATHPAAQQPPSQAASQPPSHPASHWRGRRRPSAATDGGAVPRLLGGLAAFHSTAAISVVGLIAELPG